MVNVDGVVVQDEEYLLIERSEDEEHAAGMLAFPGGKVEERPDSEDVITETARRELSEEVGIEIDDVEYVLSSTFEADDGTQCLNILTLCDYDSGEPYAREPEEVADVHWLTVEEIRQRDPPEFFLRYIDKLSRSHQKSHDPVQ
ncbi:8-oxo-dGTP diphosphatase [Halalkaliarchaeum desulfuricum]|uniref:8-oxo-dGTP diphosphatase n=1 Tax=Halalkaliarchaeum desulfuricum TaxID=2055893 RepID=A0A343TNF8_9EURY|nr:8-oxo-dGTP diphosphatase [Halalkaliarchaeum desulfuricum]